MRADSPGSQPRLRNHRAAAAGTTCLHVLLAILVSHLLAIGEIPFEGGIEDQFFADGVAGQLPGELVAPAGLFIGRTGAQDVLAYLLELAVIVLDSLGDLSHGDG